MCSAVFRRTARIGCRSTSPHLVKSGSGPACAAAKGPPPPVVSTLRA
jgi:hypothetical protein